MKGFGSMTGENFKRFHASKGNPLREKLDRLEKKHSEDFKGKKSFEEIRNKYGY